MKRFYFNDMLPSADKMPKFILIDTDLQNIWHVSLLSPSERFYEPLEMGGTSFVLFLKNKYMCIYVKSIYK